MVGEFCDLQKRLADFVREWGEADLGDLKVKDPLFPLHLTVDTQLLIIVLPQPAASVAGSKCEAERGVSRLKPSLTAKNIYHRGTENTENSF